MLTCKMSQIAWLVYLYVGHVAPPLGFLSDYRLQSVFMSLETLGNKHMVKHALEKRYGGQWDEMCGQG